MYLWIAEHVPKPSKQISSRASLKAIWPPTKNLVFFSVPSIRTPPTATAEQLKVKYHDIISGIAAPHLIKGLFSHLSTSGSFKFQELAGDKGKINELRLKTGQYSQALLELIKIMTDEVIGYRTQVEFHNEVKPGITR